MGFAWWAGYTTGSAEYEALKCGENIYTQNKTLQYKWGSARGGMFVGIGSFIVAFIFIIVGFIASIITGIKLAVDTRKRK